MVFASKGSTSLFSYPFYYFRSGAPSQSQTTRLVVLQVDLQSLNQCDSIPPNEEIAHQCKLLEELAFISPRQTFFPRYLARLLVVPDESTKTLYDPLQEFWVCCSPMILPQHVPFRPDL